MLLYWYNINMKINIISDIHATYNIKKKTVEYNLPPRYSKKKYNDALVQLKKYWTEHGRILVDEYKYSSIQVFITNLAKLFKTEFVGMQYSDLTRISEKINEIIAKIGRSQWNKKNTVNLVDIRNRMYKYVYDFDPTKLEPADYLIIAGDIGIDNIYDKILQDIEEKTAGKFKGKFKKILHVAGNHDHWWIGKDCMNIKKPDSVNLSHDYSEHVDGEYVFLGCTLWTPIPDRSIWTVGRNMNDYRYTPGNFSPYASREQYRIQSEWLKTKLDQYKDKKVIVFTHHQPFEELTLEDYKHNGSSWDGVDVNAAYVVLDHSLDDVNKNKNIVLWACGHTHQCYDDIIHDVHVVRNPIGYRDHYGYTVPENPSDTWYNKVIDV